MSSPLSKRPVGRTYRRRHPLILIGLFGCTLFYLLNMSSPLSKRPVGRTYRRRHPLILIGLFGCTLFYLLNMSSPLSKRPVGRTYRRRHPLILIGLFCCTFSLPNYCKAYNKFTNLGIQFVGFKYYDIECLRPIYYFA